jgi:hypothetical protein
MKRNYLLLILLSFFLILFGCMTSGSQQKSELKKQPEKKGVQKTNIQIKYLYTKYNIHIMNSGKDIKAYYTNWIGPFSGHSILSLNTKVMIKEWSKGFILHRVDTGRDIYFLYNGKHMKMSVTQYINIITSNKKTSISGFSALDKKGIKDGKVYLGMTKNGIISALGYPAKHKTPSLKNKYWVYWQNKWITKTIQFNNSGIVINVI